MKTWGKRSESRTCEESEAEKEQYGPKDKSETFFVTQNIDNFNEVGIVNIQFADETIPSSTQSKFYFLGLCLSIFPAVVYREGAAP